MSPEMAFIVNLTGHMITWEITALGLPVRVFLEGLKCRGMTYLLWAWPCSLDWGPELNKKE